MVDCTKINVLRSKLAVTLIFENKKQVFSMIFRLFLKLFENFGTIGMPVRIRSGDMTIFPWHRRNEL